jgi:three-Cys-motif partner protein
LDPEGTELSWATVEEIAKLPRRLNKVELLILFPLEMGLLRLLTTVEPMEPERDRQISSNFGSEAWKPIYSRRLSGSISPEQAKELYLELYCGGLRELGYGSVIQRPILSFTSSGGKRQTLYHLVFATDSEQGDKIMRDVFTRP